MKKNVDLLSLEAIVSEPRRAVCASSNSTINHLVESRSKILERMIGTVDTKCNHCKRDNVSDQQNIISLDHFGQVEKPGPCI